MLTRMKTVVAGAAKPFAGSKGRHYRKSLVMMLVIASIPGMIAGMLIYWILGGRIEHELHRLHNNQIRQRAENIDEQFAYLEMAISHWAFDPKFDYRLQTIDFGRQFETTRDLTRTLLIMQGSNPMTRRVELYLDRQQPVLLNPEYSVLDEEAAAGYRDLLGRGQSVYWTGFAARASASGQKDITLVHKIPGVSADPLGVILIRLDRATLADFLEALTPYDGGETFLMQEDGGLIASASGSGTASPFDLALRQAVADNRAEEGAFLFEWQQKTYTVSYGSFARIGSTWTYVSAAPIDAITAPVVFISRWIWAISFSVLLLGAVLAWFASSRIYSPIDRLVRLLTGGKPPHGETSDEFQLIERQWTNLTRESSALQSRLEEQLTHVRDGFLHQFTQGFLYAYSEDDLRERMRRYGWTVDDRQFVALYMQLTGFANLEGRFSQGDEGLVTFAAANIVEELASVRPFRIDAVNFHDLTIGLLVVAPHGDTLKGELEALGEEIMQAINRLVKMQVTIAISRPAASVAQVPSLFEEAKQALSHRQFIDQNQIIDMEKPEAEEGADEMRYPFAIEREVVQAVRTGQRDEAQRLIGDFLEALQAGDGAKEIDVQQGMLQMLAAIQHTVMHAGLNPSRIYQGVNMYEQLSDIREPQRMLAWFRQKVIEPFMRELEQRSDSQVRRLVESVMIYMQDHYMHDISLDQCADRTGTSPYFLSKSFKRITGKNFIDYLTELRTEKAKELLRDTELKINDVAEQVGYQHSYFNRIFKRQENMTPTQYRGFSRSKNG